MFNFRKPPFVLFSRRHPHALLATAAVAVSVLTGCDEQAAQFAAAQQKLDQALAVMAVAQQGYVAADDQAQTQGIQDFRQQRLAQTHADLRQVLTSGSPDQKAVAGRLLSSVLLSSARYTTRDAIAEYAQLAARSQILTGALHAAERAAAHAAMAAPAAVWC